MSCSTEHELLENNDFKLFRSLRYEDTIPLKIYKSETTGITVCIAEIEGPLIHGSFNIATETFDNDGLPHAVARLIFTGSKEIPSYPIYNTFEFLAERNLVTTFNTLTLPDRTCFTMTAAGSEGFLNMMSIYLDHIFLPTLKESAYLIKVHNITSEGNAGELYCNAQSRECTPHYIINKTMVESLYPGKCGYKSLIKGTTKNFRESTNNIKVKQFHQKFYRLENLTIFITGSIKHDKRQEYFIRPWQTPIEQLTNSVDVDVNFPSTDEKYSIVYVAWRGPSPVTQVYEYHGCRLLLRYLEMTTLNPLKKHFVEKNDLFWKYRTYEWSDSVFNIMFLNVPVEHLQLMTTKSIVGVVLNDIISNGINMKMLSTVIHQTISQYKLALEKNPHTEIESTVFNHIIHGNIYDEQYIDQSLNKIRELEKLKNEPVTFFFTLLETYFINAPMVVVKGKPSVIEYLNLQVEEHETNEQITKLSKRCLQETEKQLKLTIAQKYGLYMPPKLLERVPIPSTKSISFHHIKRYNTETKEQHSKLDVKKLPLFTYLDDVKTNVVYLQIIMDTSSISTEYKNYIYLLMDVLQRSPVKKNDRLISYEKIIAPLDIISSKFRVNINNMGNHSHSMSLTLQIELKKYENSVQLCKELLYNTVLTAETVKISTEQLLNNSTQVKATEVLDALMQMILYKNDSIPFMSNKLQQLKFFNDVRKRLDTEAGQKEVITEIEYVRKTVTSVKNMFVHIAVNVEQLTKQVSDVYAPWTKFFSNCFTSEKTKPNLIADWDLVKPFENYTFNGCVLGVEFVKSSYFAQACPCITDVRHPDLPAVIVCLKYFTQGPMRQELKDKALLYDFYFNVSVNDGLLHLGFIRAPNLVLSYSKAKEIVELHVANMKWNQHLYEKAKSLAISHFITNVRSIKRMTKVSLKYSCNNVPFDYVYDYARRISTVTMEDLSRVTSSYVKPLFDPKKSKTAIMCNIDKVTEIEKAFYQINFNLKVFKNINELNLDEVI